MIITVVGLGLIGGSLCKAIKKHTNHTVYGVDIDRETIDKRLRACRFNYRFALPAHSDRFYS